MANNRLYIRCKRCGKCVHIGKHFGRVYCTPTNVGQSLDDFFREHAFCGEISDGFEDRGDFEIAYEIAPNGEVEREIE